MPEPTLKQRVGDLEVRADRQEERMAAVEEQLREFRGEFNAFRVEVRNEFAAVRQEFREEIAKSADRVREDLRGEIAKSADETRRYMRVLYEDLVQRIKTLGEGFPPPTTAP
ncbi:MAG: hypothetical protein KGN76_06645 [Acidobacteriota bacterium]|nr:hypothetical protein [Acidobacteriota bacterium]